MMYLVSNFGIDEPPGGSKNNNLWSRQIEDRLFKDLTVFERVLQGKFNHLDYY